MKKLLLVITCSVWSFVSLAQTLFAPVLTSPNSGATVVDVNIRLVWAPSLGGTVSGYDAEIDTDTNFSSPVSLNILGTSSKTSELDFNQVYYWRARGKNSIGPSPWSQVWSFKTFYNEFTGLSPSGGNKNPRVNLAWDTVAGVSSYVYEIDDDSNFTSSSTGNVVQPDPSLNVLGKAKATIDNLIFGNTYYWRVKAKHTLDESGWSDVKVFTVINSIELTSPSDGVINVTPSRKLTCKNTPGVNEYRFATDDNTLFNPASPAYSLTTVFDKDFNGPISITTNLLLFGKTYYWRVQGVNFSGISNWSETRSMTVVDFVDLVKPADGASNIDASNVVFRWNRISGSEQYEMQYDTLSTFATYKSIIPPNDTNEIALSLKIIGKPYYWRVRAIHSRDTSGWSTEYSFTATPVGINEIKANYSFEIFPNPAQGEIYIDLNAKTGGELRLRIYNIVGEELDEVNFGIVSKNKRINYNIDNLKTGIYMVVLDFNGERITRRLSVR